MVPTLQAEAGRVELELSMTKLRAEEASLRDSLSKLSALNESLAQDKLGLNRLVAQVCRVPVGAPVSALSSPFRETPPRRPRPSLGPHPPAPCLAAYLPVHLCPGTCLSWSPLFLSLTLSVCLLSYGLREKWLLGPSSLLPPPQCPQAQGHCPFPQGGSPGWL